VNQVLLVLGALTAPIVGQAQRPGRPSERATDPALLNAAPYDSSIYTNPSATSARF